MKFDTDRIFKISDADDLPKTEDFLYEISNNHGFESTDSNQKDDQKENLEEVIGKMNIFIQKE